MTDLRLAYAQLPDVPAQSSRDGFGRRGPRVGFLDAADETNGCVALRHAACVDETVDDANAEAVVRAPGDAVPNVRVFVSVAAGAAGERVAHV